MRQCICSEELKVGQRWQSITGGPSCTIVGLETDGQCTYILYRFDGEDPHTLPHRRSLERFLQQFEL